MYVYIYIYIYTHVYTHIIAPPLRNSKLELLTSDASYPRWKAEWPFQGSREYMCVYIMYVYIYIYIFIYIEREI